MKKIITLSLVALLLLSLCSCGGKPKGMSDAMYQIGLNALAVVDQYIAGEITGDDAYERIKEFRKQADTQTEKNADEEYQNDDTISHRIAMLSSEILFSKSGTSAMSDVMEERDKLAEALGKKKQSKAEKTTTAKVDNYTYEQEKEIIAFIKDKISIYNLDVYVSENENGLSIHISSKEKDNYAENYFADILTPSLDAVTQAKTEFGFDVSKADVTFLLYKSSFEDDPTGTISYTTENLEKGMLIYSKKYITRSNITVEQAIEILKQN